MKGPAIAFICLSALLSLLTPDFLQTTNLTNVLLQSAINGVLAAGMTFVILTGGIDLAVGSILALSGMVLGKLLLAGTPVPLALLGALAVASGLGLLSGLMVTRGKLPPFIATLGMMSAARGLALVYSGGRPASGFSQEFLKLAEGPVLVSLMAAVYIIAGLALQRTVYGRSIYALGGNEQAAWLSGLPTERLKCSVYVLSGFLSGVAAIMLTARLNSAQPIAGVMYELDAIAAVVMGGTSLSGGAGGVMGTLFGALIMGVLRNGLNLLEVSADMQQVVIGVVIVLAVLVDRSREQITRTVNSQLRQHPKRSGLLATATLVLIILGATGYRSAHQNKGPVIAFVMKTKNNPFWVDMEEAAQKSAEAAGVRLIVQAPERETDVEKQMQIVENLIQKRVSALVLAPCGSKEIVPAILKANEAGIPVLIVDTRVDEKTLKEAGAKTETFIGSDNFHGGELAGEYMCQMLKERGRVIILEGIAGHETVDARRRGFVEALKKHPGVVVAASQTANAEQEKAFNVTQNLLQSNQNIQGIFGCNDVMALGALAACKSMNRPDIVIVGFDASAPGRQAIQEKTMAGSVAQYPSEMGRLGVEKALSVLQGEKLPDYLPTKVEVVSVP
ncbi:MAG: substrate-binding domain-containing protein [Candidatus Eremiobacteraeota bacterium]|nr:substrate-binding domain-containing protein [Candidatus Eremiobacteraeota bacterium]MCW5866828.1 substrate-binding domain-containing protein [Candidatus Eremiobacteraeota bacterium]